MPWNIMLDNRFRGPRMQFQNYLKFILEAEVSEKHV